MDRTSPIATSSRIEQGLVLCLVLILGGCGTATTPGDPSAGAASTTQLSGLAWFTVDEGLRAVPLATRSGSVSATRFTSLSVAATGLDFAHNWKPSDDYKFEIYNSLPGGGVCIGDYNGDDFPDVFLTQSHVGNRLYENLGDMEFKDVTESVGLSSVSAGQGATFIDVDNDSDLDLYVCNKDQPNQLFINNGDGTFSDEAEKRGVDFVGNSVMMTFADFDHDGDLDGYLVTNRSDDSKLNIAQPVANADGTYVIPEESREFVDVIVDGTNKSRVIRAAQFDHLYQNNGDGTFSDVSKTAGLVGNYWGLSAVWWDYDRDGWTDIYVSNDFYSPDQLYRNNGDGTFTDIAETALPHTPWYSMGADVADINNDGWLDFAGSDMSGTSHYKQKASMGDMGATGWFLVQPTPRQYMRNALYLNTGTHRFMEIAQMAGVANTDWTWSLKFADFDEDGWTDLYVTNGMNRDWTNSDIRNASTIAQSESEKMRLWLESPQRRDPNIAFRNTGDLRFEKVGDAWGLADEKVSYGAALADLDRDGDLDIVANNAEESASVYRNDTHDTHRILVRLRGVSANRHGVGAVVIADEQSRVVTTSQGYMASNETLVHFGLGTRETVKRLEIHWPGGNIQRYENLPADHYYTVTEKRVTEKHVTEKQNVTVPVASRETIYKPTNELAHVTHHESPFNDYARQPLLPNQLSQLGPSLACGDVNGDGSVDAYVGGSSGEAGRLLINSGGQFAPAAISAFEIDSECEDMGALLVDVDGDADLDLYVVSGGVECEPDDDVLNDRLYINDGRGVFAAADSAALPNLRDSGGPVSAADFDRDGDLDLFVGGRVIPGQYPLTPQSRLLENNDGKFTDVTDSIAPGLRESGLVTSSIWSDVDADGWLDLLVTHEWGPVGLYRNQIGQLTNGTVNAGLAERLGWHNSIASSDVDGDGDMDYLVGNFGWNTKYHTSVEKPTLLYYGDFENAGRSRLVEAEFENETLFPVRGKSCSTNAMPFLGEKFTKFHDFAVASLQDIYTPDRLETSHRYEANSLDSGTLVNNRTGKFTFVPFPTLAQAAPIFGIVVTEVNGDGIPDAIVAQNFYGPQPETGRFDGGVSLVLLGKGDGSFGVMPTNISGIVVPGDAKAVCLADINGNGQPEVIITTNDGPCHTFTLRDKPQSYLSVTLQGKAPNTQAIGSRVRVHYSNGATIAYEVTAGGGYLSQSPCKLFVDVYKRKVAKIDVTWPNGDTSPIEVDNDARDMVISQPDGVISELNGVSQNTGP